MVHAFDLFLRKEINSLWQCHELQEDFIISFLKMNQQFQGSGTPNSSLVKRKRGRPRKEARTLLSNITPIRCVPDTGINPNQPAGTTGSKIVMNTNQPVGAGGSGNDEMLGTVVTGVIAGCFGGGYLLNVRIADSPTYFQGVVFRPGQYVPITPVNDVAPHLEMIQRRDFSVPVFIPQAQMQSSIRASGQGSKQPVEHPPLVPISGSSILLDNKSASVVPGHVMPQTSIPLAPMTNVPPTDSSIPAGGTPQTLSVPGQGSQPALGTKMECDKNVEYDTKKLDTSKQVKELGADGGIEKDSKLTAEDDNLLPMTENMDLEQDAGSSVPLDKLKQDSPKITNFELNQMAAPAVTEAIQSEQNQDELKSSNIVANKLPVSAELEAMQSKQILDARNPNLEPMEMPESINPENLQSVDKFEVRSDSPKPAPGGDVVPSASEGSTLQETSDPNNHGPSGSCETTKVDDSYPSGDTTKSVKPEIPIGPGIL